MKIGIIGAGNIGATAARLFKAAGHEVVISNSRGAESLESLAAEIGATAADVNDTAAFGDVVLVSIPLGKYKSLPSDALSGKIVIDSNNYYPGRDGQIEELDSETATSSELLSRHLAGARIVKAFNTIWFEHLRSEGSLEKPLEERRVIFISGNDREANEIVARLIEEIGFAPYYIGGLKDSALQQPDSAVYNKSITIEEAGSILEQLNAANA